MPFSVVEKDLKAKWKNCMFYLIDFESYFELDTLSTDGKSRWNFEEALQNILPDKNKMTYINKIDVWMDGLQDT